MSPSKGRPTSNPKGKSIHVRLDEKSETILNAYMEQENTTQAESIRRGIAKLEEDLKK